ncbi:hypothetical protein CcI49_04010 [Frankia sp. CcI49]|nr:hypothetical protein ACG83_18260 [Frankia sp. R43]ONH61956.1 hypothetical protein CcI49_04010 [Frankia sp. CcI49]
MNLAGRSVGPAAGGLRAGAPSRSWPAGGAGGMDRVTALPTARRQPRACTRPATAASFCMLTAFTSPYAADRRPDINRSPSARA